MNSINVKIFGIDMGLLYYYKDRILFHYYPSFVQTKLEPSPMLMPNKEMPYNFSGIEYRYCSQLPHMMADTLPDKFGNSVMQNYLAHKGIEHKDLSPLEKLAYVGNRGIGAITYEPTLLPHSSNTREINLTELQEMCQSIIDEKSQKNFYLSHSKNVLEDLMLVSSTAGGAQPKALIYRKNDHIISGLSKPKDGYAYEIVKVINKENIDDGKIEFIYHKIAKNCGIHMTQCQLLQSNHISHFVTERFDINSQGERTHIQSLAALIGRDFRTSDSSFEQMIKIIKSLDGNRFQKEQLFRRAVFNIVAGNRDDHMKNVSFLMTKAGEWSLSPAYDLTFFCPQNGSAFVEHSTSINGKRNRIKESDIIRAGMVNDIYRPKQILEEIQDSFRQFEIFAKELEVTQPKIEEIIKTTSAIKQQLKLSTTLRI